MSFHKCSRFIYIVQAEFFRSLMCNIYFFRLIAAAQMTASLTPRLVLSVLSVLDKVSQQLRVRKNLLRTKKLPQFPPQDRKASGRPLRRLSLPEKSTTVPSEAWAAPKHFSRVSRSLSSPAHLPFLPAPNQLLFPRTSIWLMTGWKTIWWRSSRRKSGGFGWSRMGQE